jgi:hypothetical protein
MSDARCDLTALAGRVTALERENRRLKGLAGGAASLLALLAIMGQARPGARLGGRIVEAEGFVVRDQAGQLRATLGTNANGVGLVLIGATRVSVGVTPEGIAGVQLLDTDGRRRAALAMTSDGASSLRLLDSAAKERVVLAVPTNGTAGLLVADATGRIRGTLATEPDGSSALDLLDGSDKTRLSLSTKPDGSPSLSLLGEHGQLLFKAPPPAK